MLELEESDKSELDKIISGMVPTELDIGTAKKLSRAIASLTDERIKLSMSKAEARINATIAQNARHGRDTEKKSTSNARTHQSVQDKRIATLEAEVAKLTEERDAARKAYLDLLGEAKS